MRAAQDSDGCQRTTAASCFHWPKRHILTISPTRTYSTQFTSIQRDKIVNWLFLLNKSTKINLGFECGNIGKRQGISTRTPGINFFKLEPTAYSVTRKSPEVQLNFYFRVSHQPFAQKQLYVNQKLAGNFCIYISQGLQEFLSM